MRATIGAVLYFVFCVAAVVAVLFGLLESDDHGSTAAAGLASVFGGGILYLIGRDIRRTFRGE